MFIDPMKPIDTLSGFETLQTTNEQSNPGLFRSLLEGSINNLIETEMISQNDSALLATGNLDDLSSLGINATKAYLAERFVIEVRNRALDAYSELMRISM